MVVCMMQVAWIHLERSGILTVQNRVITRNPRISVSHDQHHRWNLHINNIQESDSGGYMCQINTAVAKTRIGHVTVVGQFIKFIKSILPYLE